MAYSDFSLRTLRLQFGVENKVEDLFPNTTPVQPSALLKESLEIAKRIPIKSEKSRSELIVMPILIDAMRRSDYFFTIYSGDTLVADKEVGLTGECDFILAQNTNSFDVNTPILTLVEAKKNDIEAGIPQCAAQMLGANIYNKEAGIELEEIYGCVTTGTEWRFLRLKNNSISIDDAEYFIVELEKLLGVFQFIMNKYKETLN